MHCADNRSKALADRITRCRPDEQRNKRDRKQNERSALAGCNQGPLLKTSVLPATDNPRSAINRVDWPTAVAATAERAEGCASHGQCRRRWPDGSLLKSSTVEIARDLASPTPPSSRSVMELVRSLTAIASGASASATTWASARSVGQRPARPAPLTCGRGVCRVRAPSGRSLTVVTVRSLQPITLNGVRTRISRLRAARSR